MTLWKPYRAARNRSHHLNARSPNGRQPPKGHAYVLVKTNTRAAAPNPETIRRKMSTFRLSLTTIKRSKGQSAVAACAYRSGEALRCEKQNRIFDYRRRNHRTVVEKRLIGWGGTRASFANEMEKNEKRCDSVVAREIQLSLPAELSAATRAQLANAFGYWLRVRFGVAVDVCIHRPSKGSDSRNHHAHLLFSARVVDDAGRFGAKTLELDNRKSGGKAIEEMRSHWADQLNCALRTYGFPPDLDHRSNARRGMSFESESVSRSALGQRQRRKLESPVHHRERAGRNTRRKMRHALSQPRLVLPETGENEVEDFEVLPRLVSALSHQKEKLPKFPHDIGDPSRCGPIEEKPSPSVKLSR
jgi:hypothetical protein